MTTVLLSIALFTLGVVPGEAPAEPDAGAIRAAVEKAVPPIERSLADYVRQRDCFACHHQGLGVLALTTARDRGCQVNDGLLREQLAFTASDLQRSIETYRKGRGQGGGAIRAGYALWTLELGGRPPDENTAAVAAYLLENGRDEWRTTSRRPPAEASPFTATFVALRAVRAFASPDQSDRVTERVAKAREWLLRTPAGDNEERVFRLWALKLAAADEGAVRDAAQKLRDAQLPNGGWAQVADTEADAYATGSALVALQQTAQLATDDPAYRRGLAFLLRSQQPDGSWHVGSRSRPFQTYFESGFPHGKDQFISMAATGWATTALALALR